MRRLLFAFLMFPLFAYATDEGVDCAYGSFEQMMSEQCGCTKKFPSKKIPTDIKTFINQGYKLVEVCGGFTSPLDNHEILGSYGFRANHRITGTVYYGDGVDVTHSIRPFSSSVDSARLESNASEDWFKEQNDKLKMPNKPNLDCIKAKATLKINKFYVHYTPGSNGEGVQVVDYNVLNVGKWVCNTRR